MIYIIHKMLVLLKNDRIFECFFKECNKPFLKIFFFRTRDDEKFKS